MALLSKKEFAELSGMETKKLSVYVKRNKVHVGEDGRIDTDNLVNRAFLEKNAKNLESIKVEPTPPENKQMALPLKKVVDMGGSDENEDDGSIPDYHVSEKLLKHLDTQKREQEIEKLKLDIQKKMGEVVPVAPIETLVFQFKQSVLTTMKMGYERYLNEIGHKYTIVPDDMAYYKGLGIKTLNDCIAEATELFITNLGTTLNEFAIKKGVGERAD